MPKITLKAARVNVKLTQKEVADCIGCSVSTIKNWENGITFPRYPQIEKLCELYGVPLDNINFCGN